MLSLETELQDIQHRGLYRKLTIPAGVDFASNDFLGLSQSPKIRAALQDYLSGENPLGSQASRLVGGESQLISNTEEYLAKEFQVPATLFFGSGYLANLGVTTALACPGAEFFSDELNHASLIDGMRLSKSPVAVFRHNDFSHLESLLGKSGASRKIIVTESVFSMDGDGPDLNALKNLADKYQAFLILDEAHATGVTGARGLGRFEIAAVDWDRTVLVHTCGKALGGYGAFVGTSRLIREVLINRARSFIYSTAPPPLQIIHTRVAVEQITTNKSLREELHRNIQSFHRQLFQAAPEEMGHIVTVHIPGNDQVTKAERQLLEEGFFVKAIRSPTVPEGQERLRITIKAFHAESDLSRFAQSLKEIRS